jgi:hypothetical protein
MMVSGIASKLSLSIMIPVEKSSPVTGHVSTIAPMSVPFACAVIELARRRAD